MLEYIACNYHAFILFHPLIHFLLYLIRIFLEVSIFSGLRRALGQPFFNGKKEIKCVKE